MPSLLTRQLLQQMQEAGVMPTQRAMATLESQPEPRELLRTVLSNWDQRKVFCDLTDLLEVIDEALPPSAPESDKNLAPERPEKRPSAPPLVIIEDVGDRPLSGSSAEDFAAFFGDRYKALAQLVRRRAPMREATDIANLDRLADRGEVRLVAMVAEVIRTKKGIRIKLEDPSGSVVAANYDDAMLLESQLLVDEVVGVVANRRRGSQLKLQEVHHPSFERPAPPQNTPSVTAAFVSDIHIGSHTFLAEGWETFMAWCRGEGGPEPELARRLGYLVLNGDLVDGIDAYPNQQDDLEITDIYEQYRLLAESLSTLPKNLQIILLPGNHDAVRLMEPQPALPPNLRKHFPPNVTFLSNPSTFDLVGVRVLAYHGKSLDDLVTHLPHVSYENPLVGMQELLERRHLAPIYGDKTPMVPSPRDHHIIRHVPHIFVTGHVHSAGIDRYKGVMLLNPGTWQTQTDYQKMMNFSPDPGKAAVVELNTLTPHMLDFNPA